MLSAFSSPVLAQAAGPDLAVAISDGDVSLGWYQYGRYTVTISNAGTSSSSGTITATTTLPNGLSATSSVATDWTCKVVGQVVTCTTTATIAVAASSSFAINFLTTAQGSFSTTATVSGGSDVNLSNNTATDTTKVLSAKPDLVTKMTHSGNFYQGQTGASYTVTISNVGEVSMPAVGYTWAKVELVPGLRPTAISTPACQWSLQPGGIHLVECSWPGTPATFTPGASVSFTITVDVALDAASPERPWLDPLVNAIHLIDGAYWYGEVNAANLNWDLTTIDLRPTVSAVSSSGIKPNAATLKATVNANGHATTVSFVYGTDSTLSSKTTTVQATPGSVSGKTNTAVSAAPTGLKPDTTYYFKALATNWVGAATASIDSFTLPPLAIVATTAATKVAGTTATLNGRVTANLPDTSVRFVYGRTADLASGTTSVTAAESPLADGTTTAVTAALTELTRGVTYYYKAVASNAAGTVEGAALSFVTPKIDLTAAISHAANFTQGQTSGANYTVRVTSVGNTASSGDITVTVTLPSGMAPGTATGTGWQCTTSALTVTCVRSATLDPGSAAPDIAVPVTISALAAPSLTATAAVSGGSDQDASNNVASDATTIEGAPEIRVAMDHTGTFTQGQTDASYRVTISNAGRGASAQPVTTVITLPAGLTLVRVTGTGWRCDTTTSTATCERADALAGGASFAEVTVTVAISPMAATPLDAKATVSGGGDTDVSNNAVTDVTAIAGAPELRIALGLRGAIWQGTTAATYDISISNAGRAATSGAITVSIVFPAGLTPTSAHGSDWQCTPPQKSTVTCVRETPLASEATAMLSAVFDVALTASTGVTTAATVAGGGDTDSTNNTAAYDTRIGGGLDLQVTASALDEFRQGRSGVRYSIAVESIGEGPTTGTVVLTAQLPVGLTPTAASGQGWTCRVNDKIVTCTRADVLPSRGSFPLVLITDVARSAPASVDTTFTVTGGNDIDPANNSYTLATAIAVATARADVGVAISAAAATVAVDETATLLVTVTNYGPDATAGVMVDVLVPPDLAAKTAEISQGGYDQSSGRWSIGVLAPGASVTLQLGATVLVTGSSTVLATRAASSQFDPSSANDSAAVMLNAGSTTDLGVSIRTSSGARTEVGESLTLTVLALNQGPEPATDAVVSVHVPPGLSTVAQTPSTGAYDAASGRWSIGALTVGEVATLSLTLRLDDNGIAIMSARVVRSGLTDLNPLNDYTTTSVNGGDSASLYLTKWTSRREVAVDQHLALTTVVTNDGPATVQNLVISDLLPSDLVFVSATPSEDAYDRSSGLWTIGPIAPGERRALRLLTVMRAQASATSTSWLSSGADRDPLADDNVATVTVSAIPVSDIEVTIDAGARPAEGESVEYTVRVRNLGPSDATGVAVMTGSPSASDARARSRTSAASVAASGEWAIGALAAGEMTTLTTVQPLKEGAVLRAARTKGDQFDPVIANNQAAASPIRAAWADVQIDVHADVLAPVVGEPVTITLRVHNEGPKVASHVSVALPLPEGYTVNSSHVSAGTYSTATSMFAIGTLAVDSDATLTIRGIVAKSGSLVFVARKSSSEPFDPVAANDEAGTAVNATVADLQVVTSVDKTEPLLNERLTITTVLTNNSRVAASGIVVDAKLPAALRYVKHSATAGVYDAATGAWRLETIPAAGPTGHATLTVVVAVTARTGLNAVTTVGAFDQIDLVSTNNLSVLPIVASGWSTVGTDLEIDARAGPRPVAAGALLTYTVTSTNRGPSYSADVSITGTVPDGTTFVSLSPTPGGECNQPAVGTRGIVTCTWPDITRLESRALVLAVRVGTDPLPRSAITASFSTTAPIPEYFPANNATTMSVSLVEATPLDLDVTGIAQFDGVTGSAMTVPVTTAGVVRFTVRNRGPVVLGTARFAIQGLDADEVVLDRAQPSMGQLVTTAGGGEWTIAGLVPSASATLDLFLRVQGMRSSAIAVRRADSAPGDVNAANDAATVVLDGIGPSREARAIATGDVDGVAGDELLVGGGEFETPFVSTIRADGSETRFMGLDRRFLGGVRVAACDVDGDGIDEVILGSGPHGGPHLRVMRGATAALEELVGFYAFEPSFDRGITVACVDTDGDNRAEVVVARAGGPPEVAVFAIDRRGYRRIASFLAYEPTYTGGVNVAAVPPNLARARGVDFQFATAPAGPGRVLEIKAWRIVQGRVSLVKTLTPAPTYTHGAFIACADLDEDGAIEVVAGTPSGVEPILGLVDYATGQLVGLYRPFAGLVNVSGIHMAIGTIAGATEPWLFVTPARGQSAAIDAYRLVNRALQGVTRVRVIESP